MVMGLEELLLLILLFTIGIMTHIFGFVANEYIDLELDKHSKALKNKPLVKGTISKKSALFFLSSAIVIAYVLTFIFIYLNSNGFGLIELLVPILLLSLSWVSIGLYDLVSKKFIGSDILLALWPFFLVLFGGSIVTLDLIPILYIVAGLAFMQLLIQNIMAGLKDLEQDQKGGGISTPIRFGVKLNYEIMEIPKNFIAFLNILKVFYLILILLPFIMGWFSWATISFVFIIYLFGLSYYFFMSICHSQQFNRKQIIRYIGGHEIIAYSIIPAMLMDTIGPQRAFFLIILPIVWLAIFLIILYDRLMPEI
ncbi:MAG: UbiA family prenyltransferase [Thermoplasmata archaeon]|nr:UbiA family prenyltransferase [Thermoplasmata archaeon]